MVTSASTHRAHEPRFLQLFNGPYVICPCAHQHGHWPSDNRAEQASAFESLPIFEELVSSMTARIDYYVRMKHEDWTLHLEPVLPNHKESPEVISEMEEGGVGNHWLWTT